MYVCMHKSMNVCRYAGKYVVIHIQEARRYVGTSLCGMQVVGYAGTQAYVCM